MRQGSPSIVRLLLSDSQLARLAANGDEGAFDAIFRRHQQDLYRFCLAMTGDPQDAQAATQSTMTRLRRALPEKDRRTELKPWLYRLARDEVAAVQRAVQVKAPPQSAESRVEAQRLLSDLERLPPSQRAVLVMRELSGLGLAEIGAAFETTPAAIRKTLYEARLGIREVERGREARCQETMRYLSNADGRTPWRPRHHLHLRECPDCRAFRDEIAARRGGLTALTSLPLAASATALVKLAATATATVAVVVGVAAVERGKPVEADPGSGPAPTVSRGAAGGQSSAGRALASSSGSASTGPKPIGAVAGTARARLSAEPAHTAKVDTARSKPAGATEAVPAPEGEAAQPAIAAHTTPAAESTPSEQNPSEDTGAVPLAELVLEADDEDEAGSAPEPVAELAGETPAGPSLPLPTAEPEAESPTAGPHWGHRDGRFGRFGHRYRPHR
ncbi:MAG TPA: sigma-70 family RNA polymerase sigma factor [Solirubrobacterales bacterium]|nr:sigma-70 family RNA polymerase sigma factor [Solirubrobacterales bacterium]